MSIWATFFADFDVYFWGVAPLQGHSGAPKMLPRAPARRPGMIFDVFVAFRIHLGIHFGLICGFFIWLLWLIFPQRLSGGIFVNFGPECSPKEGFAGRLMCFPYIIYCCFVKIPFFLKNVCGSLPGGSRRLPKPHFGSLLASSWAPFCAFFPAAFSGTLFSPF